MANISEAWMGVVGISACAIDDGLALKSRGPPFGAVVVTAEAAELFDIKFGVGK